MKVKSNKDADKTAKETSVKAKAAEALGCRKLGKSAKKVSKQRCQISDNNNEYYLPLPSSPLLLSKSPLMASSTTNIPQNILTPISVPSHLQIKKFQLQLFPIDEHTRKSLEEENYCPHLELTITTKKKISSVIRHLNIKWGNSRSALEELFLFPYNAEVDNLESYERWSLRDSITAAEVHDIIGKPAVFRLRYGWLNLSDPKMSNISLLSHILANQSNSREVPGREVNVQGKQQSTGASHESEPFPSDILPKQSVPENYSMEQPADNLRSENDAKLSWADGVSNMSFGALFSEVADDGAKVYHQAPQHLIPVSCDSFDAAVAAHVARYQPGNQSSRMSQPSILDAEETCNPFSFHSFTTSNKYIQHQSANVISQTVKPYGVEPYKALSPLSEHAQDDGCALPLHTILNSEDHSRPIEADPQLARDTQGHKQVEKDEMPVLRNALSTVDNQFVGLDMHWAPSVDPWQFVSPQEMINNDSTGINGFASTSMDIL